MAEEINATESALELIEAHGIEYTNIEGSGADGRILKGDVEAYLASIEDAVEEDTPEPEPEAETVAEVVEEKSVEASEPAVQERFDRTCGVSRKTHLIKP